MLFSGVPWSNGGVFNLVSYRLLNWSKPLLKKWRPGLALSPQDRPISLLDLSILDQFALKRTLLQSTSKEDYCQRFFRFLYDWSQPRGYLLEKSPKNIFYVPYIKSIFPKSKLILIYRDGRDVVVSDQFFKKDYLKKTWSFTESVTAWRRAMEAQISYTEKYDIFNCSYESLLSEGTTVIQKLLEFLELPADASIVQDLLQRSSFRSFTGRDPGQEDRRRFLRKGISGDWQNHFTEEDKKIFKELAGDMLIKLRYEKDMNW